LEPPSSLAAARAARRSGGAGMLATALGLTLLAGTAAAAEERPPGTTDGELRLLDAIHLMLEHDPNLAVGAARVRGAEGLVTSAAGRFDPALTSSLVAAERNEPIAPLSSATTRTVESSLGVRTELPGGLSITPTVQLQRTEEALGAPVNVGVVGIELRQPLLRGRGRRVNLATERSARWRAAASRADLEHLTAERVLVVATLYWELRAAQIELDILRASEASARNLLATTRRLVEADVTPAAELVQLEANLAAKEASTIAGERALFVGRQVLGREIGLEPAVIRRLPPAGDPFPAVPSAAVEWLSAPRVDDVVATAIERRDDLRAARDLAEGDRFLALAASDVARPQLDLVLVPSYTGLVEDGGAGGFFSPLYDNVPGASTSFAVSWSWPFRNRRARGLLAASEAAHVESVERVELLRRAIAADVPAALETVAAGVQQLDRAAAAVVLFEQAVVNEEKKLRAGSSTLLDVIAQRDRLTSAQLGEVAAHLTLALALLELRFEAGLLLPESGAQQLTAAHLTTLPPEVAAR
jgi:outer membrane protein TolC